MAERGARPEVPAWRRGALRAVRSLFTPLIPDDYLELIDPLWSTREMRGRIEEIRPEADGAVTIMIKPGHPWPGHGAGQYVRVGVVVDGIFHWRAYSLTSASGRSDGLISITPKLVEGGAVTPYLARQARPGEVVRLGGVEGDFVLSDPPPPRLLFVTAGSGITPVMSILTDLDSGGALGDVVLIHSARTREQVIFGNRLERLERRNDGLEVVLRITGSDGRMVPSDLDTLCPDWREREVYASGPGDLLDALEEEFERSGEAGRLHIERFQPVLDRAEHGSGGTIRFLRSEAEAESDGSKPILAAGEEAGVELPFGCREGICHTCIGTVREGRVRDLRSGEVREVAGESIRTCIHAPEGAIEIEL